MSLRGQARLNSPVLAASQPQMHQVSSLAPHTKCGQAGSMWISEVAKRLRGGLPGSQPGSGNATVPARQSAYHDRASAADMP